MNRAVLLVLALSGAAPAVSCGGAQTSSTPDELPAVCHAYVGAAEAPYRAASARPEQERPVLIEARSVMTATGEHYSPGWITFADGRISGVGQGVWDGDTDGWDIVRVPDGWVTPGIIDTHSHLGVYPTPGDRMHADGNEATAPVTAAVEAVHSVWPQDPGFERAVAGGITAMQILPGSANLIGGRGFIMKPWAGALNAEQLRFPGAPETLKMACGENPKRVYGDRGGPSTRMGSTAVMRQTWVDAEAYREQWDDYDEAMTEWCEAGAPDGDEPDRPTRNLGNETLAGVLRGDILPQIHCYRADEMLTQMQLADEFGYHIRSFHHAVEAYKIRDELAAAEIAVSTWADWWGFKLEAYDAILENAALIHEAGGIAIIHSDSPYGIQRLNQEAAKALAAGQRRGMDVTDLDALRWITANPAWALGIDDQTGTLQPGLMADIVVWSDYPFSVYARPDLVFIDGVRAFDRAERDTAPRSDFEAGQWPEMDR